VPNVGNDLQTAAAWQGKVEQDQFAAVLTQQAQHFFRPRRFGHDPDVRSGRQCFPQTTPDDGVVVDDQHVDHGASFVSGSRAVTLVPPRGPPATWTEPPKRRARSRMPTSPIARGFTSSAAGMPTPSS
jgi:hypothetical protein